MVNNRELWRNGIAKGDKMEKQCLICGCTFKTIKYGANRKFCFDCVPSGLNSQEMTHHKRRSAKHHAVIKLGGKCQKCGETREHILNFHHLNPQEKDDGLSNLLVKSKIEQFLEEINKCILLCSNCHEDFHFLESHKGITIEEYLEM